MLFPISYFLFPILIFLFSHCSEIKGCKEQCKNKTRDCTLKYQLLSRTISGSSSSVSTVRTETGSEVEPNDTFLSAYSSSSGFNNNSLGVSTGYSFILSATISSSTDVDIFDIGTNNSKDGTKNVIQKSNLDKVTCNVYLKHGTNVRDSVSRLQTPTSTPDSSFIYQGKLNPSFSFAYIDVGAVAYIICSGTANTSYSLQSDSIPITYSPSGTISILSLYTDYSYVNICKGATKTCETKCSRGF